MSKQLRVAILFGGRSSEHEVSLLSAASVIQAIDQTRFDIVPIGISKTGQWLLHDVHSLQFDDNNAIVFQENAEPISLFHQPFDSIADVVFPVMHGEFYEDGSLQGCFELLRVPYVGAGVLSSALGMDKSISKHLVKSLGVPVSPWLDFTIQAWQANPDELCQKILQTLDLPVFVKPVCAGSSVGISKVDSQTNLVAAIDEAFQFDTRVIIEKALDARDVEISVLENKDDVTKPFVSLPGEIKPNADFYSHAAKYDDAVGAEFDLPADVPKESLLYLQQYAAKIFQHLLCEGMLRVDFLLERETGIFYFNEVNTLPGFTSISLYPKLWELSGLPYADLLTYLIELALARHQRCSQLCYDLSSKAGYETAQ